MKTRRARRLYGFDRLEGRTMLSAAAPLGHAAALPMAENEGVTYREQIHVEFITAEGEYNLTESSASLSSGRPEAFILESLRLRVDRGDDSVIGVLRTSGGEVLDFSGEHVERWYNGAALLFRSRIDNGDMGAVDGFIQFAEVTYNGHGFKFVGTLDLKVDLA